MATFRTLIRGIIHGDLPPVGEKIIWRSEPKPLPTYDGFEAYWVDSGTSALALTMIAAKQLRPEIKQPEVIIPAYGCPDLVAAAVHAKMQPVLVDTGDNDPGYDLDQLDDAINSNTVAVVAVNFLGISDRLSQIKQLLPPNTYLIEDNAQCYAALTRKKGITGDFAITSFGRGKPVSLLGGGLALFNSKLPVKPNILPSKHTRLLTLKIMLYNILLTPQLYFYINRLPFLNIGETCYHPLDSISHLDNDRIRLLTQNIEKHLSTFTAGQQAFHNEVQALDLADSLKERTIRLLRHPLLAENINSREELLQQSYQLGLGLSAMYKKSLIEIDKISGLARSHSNSNAKVFSQRLLTKPTI